MNKIYLSGNLTKEPEIRTTQSGRTVASMSIAVNEGYGDKQTTNFFYLVAWEKTAELCGKYLNKGSKVLVEGRLKNNNYEGKDGVKHYAVDIIVENIEFMDKKSDKEKPTGDEPVDDDMPF